MDKEELKKEREKAFREWFEKWFSESKEFKNINEKIKEANLEGYTDMEIKLKYKAKQPKVRLDSELLLECIKEKLPGLKVIVYTLLDIRTIKVIGKKVVIVWGKDDL